MFQKIKNWFSDHMLGFTVWVSGLYATFSWVEELVPEMWIAEFAASAIEVIGAQIVAGLVWCVWRMKRKAKA